MARVGQAATDRQQSTVETSHTAGGTSGLHRRRATAQEGRWLLMESKENPSLSGYMNTGKSGYCRIPPRGVKFLTRGHTVKKHCTADGEQGKRPGYGHSRERSQLRRCTDLGSERCQQRLCDKRLTTQWKR